jgi:hypothetical protein
VAGELIYIADLQVGKVDPVPAAFPLQYLKPLLKFFVADHEERGQGPPSQLQISDWTHLY